MGTEYLRPVHASYACIPNCAVGHREYPGRYPARACTAPSFYSWPLGLAPRQTPTRGPGPAVSGSSGTVRGGVGFQSTLIAFVGRLPKGLPDE